MIAFVWRVVNMKNQNEKSIEKYYLGLDIGTDSVGYAATDTEYNLLKFNGEPVWGATIFDAGSLCDERRAFRSARRRLDRRQQRVALIQELFAKEISKKDERFFIRLQESKLFREDVQDKFILFNDADFSDKDYYEKYPTIHHLICELMKNKQEHDVRLVYLACSWLVAHRGHFLSNISIDNISSIRNFEEIYNSLISFFTDNGYEKPWNCDGVNEFGKILQIKQTVTSKNKTLIEFLYGKEKPSKEATEEFPYNREAIIKLLAGGTVKLKDLFCKDDYAETGSVSLGMDDEKLLEISGEIGEDFELIKSLREVFDWAVLADTLGNCDTISESKVQIYEQHKEDLAFLKRFIKKYCSNEYSNMFRTIGADNYVAYAYHTDEVNSDKLKKKTLEDFSKYVLSVVDKIEPQASEKDAYDDMIKRLNLRTFLPKQKNTDNRVIPYQLYLYELIKILDNAQSYLDFLNDKEDGISVREKIESIFTFKIPYYVGPLNEKSEHAWLVRKSGKIYPWNFNEMVDLDASEQNFIRRMTNYCTYIPGEPVLPKDSLAYHKFTVLNEINNLKINGEKISVDLKQKIYNDLFLKFKKVSKKKLIDYLLANGVIEKGQEELVSGIDININSNLSTHIAFSRLIDSNILSEDDVEKIIERSTYADDKTRLLKWLSSNYPQLSDEDKKYISRIKMNDFGRLSRKFLCEIEGVYKSTGECYTIMNALWNSNDNLMELLSERYSFEEEIEKIQEEYYDEHPRTLEKYLDDMYISNAVRRPIYRTLAVVKDIEKAFGAPEKIFIEVTRGGSLDQKGKRTLSRKQQILELYQKCKDEDVKLLRQELESLGENADNKLRGEKLFLYFMQLGKCMYSGKPIDIGKLGTKMYDIDHIFPQAYVKDDSIINNKVLVLSEKNGEKSDVYPIKDSIRHQMAGYWNHLKSIGLISEEKYKRLVRSTPFSENEKWGFINRQLTETSQSTKAVAQILKVRFPNTEIVYSKASIVSDFRHEFDLLKSRTFNDLHHAKDAYLNIVVGNVYSMKFSKRWFVPTTNYSIKTKTIFTNSLNCNGELVWDGDTMLSKVKRTVAKNNAHFTKYAYFKRGGLFDQMPVHASDGLVPLKKGLDTSKYGGYNKAGAMFFIPVKYTLGKKSEILIMSVEMLYGNKFMLDQKFAEEYSFKRLKHIIGKDVDSVSFPMGMRPWKVNTMLELDGFRVCIAGMANKGTILITQSIVQFAEDVEWNNYIKRVERLVEKSTENKKYVYDKEFDKVSCERNLELYDLYIKKYEETIYSKRPNGPLEVLKKGRERFMKLDVVGQARSLMNIHQTFGRMAGGCDLTEIGGVKKAAATTLSSSISNWKKNYAEARLIDSSTTGMWVKKSTNLFELL